MKQSADNAGGRGPVTRLLDVVGSIRFGVTLLTILFIYCWIGSAGLMLPLGFAFMEATNWYQLPVRQLPGLEMTEFEWFHWWPFNLMILLICVSITTATLRRIPFKPVNYGVWMIHTGLILLAIGSVWYFSTKVEGDTPVTRRNIAITLPNGETVRLPAFPGNRMTVGAADPWTFEVTEVNPGWDILTGDDAGKRAYAVSVSVHHGTTRFVRQLLAEYPEYTEDVIPGQGRAIKAIGRALVDETIAMDLELAPQDEFFLMNSRALYVREVGQTEWVERPIASGPYELGELLRLRRPADRLPRYNDYFPTLDSVWGPDAAYGSVTPRSLHVEVPAVSESDPLADQPVYVTGYLRYAVPDERRRAGGHSFDPWVQVRLESDAGNRQSYELRALSPNESTAENGEFQFHWATTEAEIDDMTVVQDPLLVIKVPGTTIDLEIPITDTATRNPLLEYTPIEGSTYEYRISALSNQMMIRPGDVISVAIVEFKNGDRTFKRFVCDDPTRNQDFPIDGDITHSGALPLDQGIDTRYVPGRRPPMISLVGGPESDRLGLILALADMTPEYRELTPGAPIDIADGVRMYVDQFSATTTTETRPLIIPESQRDRDPNFAMSMIQVQVPVDGESRSVWVQFQHYPFEDVSQALRRYPHRPVRMALADGRELEFIYSRQRMPLTHPVVLDDFILTEHVGGFTGGIPSIRDWTSVVRFEDEGSLTDARSVSVNKPIDQDGFWYFQAQWDPPDDDSVRRGTMVNGLTYTVLGVGNRHGVQLQLFGCCLSVIGMIYAFYIKPVIKRRQRQAVYAGMQETQAEREATPEPVGAGTEDA